MESILDTIKMMIGYEPDYTPFDTELIELINSSIRKLNQLGVGKSKFSITGSTETWQDFLGESCDLFVDAKTYIFMNVKLLHDPPSNSFIVNIYKEELKELEWRMNVDYETPYDDD